MGPKRVNERSLARLTEGGLVERSDRGVVACLLSTEE